jgi:hypothetical protein
VYTRVASVAMKNYKELFLKLDADCFNAYLADVKSGKKRIATGALLPHENGGGMAAHGQRHPRARQAEQLRRHVFGSMSGLPMDVCMALGVWRF